VTTPDEVRRLVREIIQESGLPRALLARDAELSRAALEAWISEARTPQPESLEQLARGLEKRSSRLQYLAFRLRAMRDGMREEK
jgi:hypothetical protein